MVDSTLWSTEDPIHCIRTPVFPSAAYRSSLLPCHGITLLSHLVSGGCKQSPKPARGRGAVGKRIALSQAPQKHAQLEPSTLGLTVGYVKARLCRQDRNVLVPPCHRWHLLLASTDNNNIPITMSSRGVQQDYKIDFHKQRFALGSSLFKPRDSHTVPPIQPIGSSAAFSNVASQLGKWIVGQNGRE